MQQMPNRYNFLYLPPAHCCCDSKIVLVVLCLYVCMCVYVRVCVALWVHLHLFLKTITLRTKIIFTMELLAQGFCTSLSIIGDQHKHTHRLIPAPTASVCVNDESQYAYALESVVPLSFLVKTDNKKSLGDVFRLQNRTQSFTHSRKRSHSHNLTNTQHTHTQYQIKIGKLIMIA